MKNLFGRSEQNSIIYKLQKGKSEVRHYARRSEKMCEDRAIFR